MSTTEQLISKICPVAGEEVQIRILYEIGFGKMCPFSLESLSIECSNSEHCPAYHTGNIKCLLFQNDWNELI